MKTYLAYFSTKTYVVYDYLLVLSEQKMVTKVCELGDLCLKMYNMNISLLTIVNKKDVYYNKTCVKRPLKSRNKHISL